MHRVGFLVVPGFQASDLAALTVFEVANRRLDRPHYAVAVLAEEGASTTSSFGLTVATQPIESGSFDTLLISAFSALHRTSDRLLNFLRDAERASVRIGAMSLGAFALGHAGLLDGRRATTHWRFADELESLFPKANVLKDQVFVESEGVWTCAGHSTAVDMAVEMVERDCGPEVSSEIAKSFVLEHRRKEGYPQRSVLLDLRLESDPVRSAILFARQNLAADLSVEALARRACLSPRHFARVFREETGQTPAKLVEALRVETARGLVENSALPIELIARQTGFTKCEHMRRAFLRLLGTSPQALRAAAKANRDM